MKKLIFIITTLLSATGVFAAQGDTLGVHLPDADELHILSSVEQVPAGSNDSYMRIVLDRKVEADKWTLIVFPAQLDGYYFGPEAERYKVTACDLTTTPITLKREKMADLDDFAPNQMYLVKSKADLDKIVAMSPGVKTKVPQVSDVTLMCLTIDEFGETTNINNTFADSNASGEKVYDIAGRLAKSVSHGIYIVNGKKIFAK